MVLSLHVAVQHGPSLYPMSRTSDVWSLRIPVRAGAPVFPADFLARRSGDEHLADCRSPFTADIGRCMTEHPRILQVFQHLVGFL